MQPLEHHMSAWLIADCQTSPTVGKTKWIARGGDTVREIGGIEENYPGRSTSSEGVRFSNSGRLVAKVIAPHAKVNIAFQA